jgi:hypothetical protein
MRMGNRYISYLLLYLLLLYRTTPDARVKSDSELNLSSLSLVYGLCHAFGRMLDVEEDVL